MDNVNAFSAFLQNGIGLTQAKQRDAVTTHGYNTVQGLIDTYNEGIKEVFSSINRANRDISNTRDKVIIWEQVKQRFYGARSEFILRIKCNASITATYLQNLDTDDLDEFVRKHNQWKEFCDAAHTMTLPNVPVPKLTKNNWKLFSQAIKEVLMRQRGTNHIPLIYVIRSTNGNYDDVWNSTEEQIINCITLQGGNFKADNSSVWSLLQENSVGTEAESIVNRYERTRNGREACNALLAHMESTSYLDNMKSRAMANLNSTVYKGEKKNFGIVRYYQVHSEAHNDLNSAGEPLSDGMKITHFLSGLEEDVALNFAISTKSEPHINTFEEFYNSFSAKLSTRLTLTRRSQANNSQRSISQMNLNNQRGGRNNGGRGNHRGGGRNDNNSRGGGRNGPRGGRGGRTGGRFRHDPTSRSWRPRADAYSSEEWSTLSIEQRQRVHDLRNVMRHNERSQQEGRRVHQLLQDDATIPSQVQLPPPPSVSNSPVPPSHGSVSVRTQSGRAGDAFSQNNQQR